jgi:hypothetical protein
MAALLTVALVLRLLVDLAPAEVRLWLAGAAGAFLTATVFWLMLVGPSLLPPRKPPAREARRPARGYTPEG